jgi:putative MATE family efflux protein
VVNVVNITLSWSLLLGWGPMPKLGWDGIAIGTSVGFAVGGVVPLVVLARGRSGLRLNWRLMRLDPALLWRLLRIGLPGGADVMSIIICQIVFLGMVNHLGTLAVAAHGVALRIESLAYLPGYAFQVAAGTLAGQFLGAGDTRRAMRSVLVACGCGCALMLAAACVLYFGASWLVDCFVADADGQVAQTAAVLVRIVAFALLPLGLLQVLTGALRGAGDTTWLLVYTFIGFLGVRLPLAWYLAFELHWGVAGAWVAMGVDLLVRCLLVVGRFLQGGWQRVKV